MLKLFLSFSFKRSSRESRKQQDVALNEEQEKIGRRKMIVNHQMKLFVVDSRRTDVEHFTYEIYEKKNYENINYFFSFLGSVTIERKKTWKMKTRWKIVERINHSGNCEYRQSFSTMRSRDKRRRKSGKIIK